MQADNIVKESSWARYKAHLRPPHQGSKQREIWGVTGLLLLIALTRIPRLMTYGFHHDEIWAVWQTFGSPAQIVEWTPYDWGPAYYLLVGIWRNLIGLHPLLLRASSALLSVLTAALVFKIGQRLLSRRAAYISILAYGALAYGIYFSGILRAYALLEMLMALTFWLTIRYLTQPTRVRALLLIAALTLLFYTQLTSVFVFGFLCLYVLSAHPRRWKPWLVTLGLAAVLCIPQVIQSFRFTQVASPPDNRTVDLLNNIFHLYSDYAGQLAVLWIVIVFVAAVWLYRHIPAKYSGLFTLWVIFPVGLYLLPPLRRFFQDQVSGVFQSRYFWWLGLPFVWWIAGGLSFTPRRVRWVCSGLLLAICFAPLPTNYFTGSAVRHTENFTWLAQHAHWGDVLLIDKSLDSRQPYEWDYIIRAFMPNGLQIVTSPEGHRRVWYAAVDGRQDPATHALVKKDRIAGEFVGPWDFLLRLYEAAPDAKGIRFENGMRFHGIDLPDVRQLAPVVTFRVGESLHVRLWWSVDEPPKVDYSVGLYLIDPRTGELLLNSSSAPQVAPQETSQWLPGRYYIEERTLILPTGIPSVELPLQMAIYQWWDNTRSTAPDQDADRLLPILRINLQSWQVRRN